MYARKMKEGNMLFEQHKTMMSLHTPCKVAFCQIRSMCLDVARASLSAMFFTASFLLGIGLRQIGAMGTCDLICCHECSI